MKTKVAVLLLVTMVLLTACGNQTIFDTQYTFTEVQIRMMDGTIITGNVKEWNDYDDGSVQIRLTNGDAYLSNYNNIVLMDKAQ